MPEITITLGALAQAEAALQRLTTLKLPVKPAYHLAKLCHYVKAELAIFSERHLALMQEYGEERPAGPGQRTWDVPPKKQKTFNKKLTELLSIEVTIPWGPFDLAPVTDVTAEDLLRLGPLVTLTTEDENKA